MVSFLVGTVKSHNEWIVVGNTLHWQPQGEFISIMVFYIHICTISICLPTTFLSNCFGFVAYFAGFLSYCTLPHPYHIPLLVSHTTFLTDPILSPGLEQHPQHLTLCNWVAEPLPSLGKAASHIKHLQWVVVTHTVCISWPALMQVIKKDACATLCLFRKALTSWELSSPSIFIFSLLKYSHRSCCSKFASIITFHSSKLKLWRNYGEV